MNKSFKFLLFVIIVFVGTDYLFSMEWAKSWASWAMGRSQSEEVPAEDIGGIEAPLTTEEDAEFQRAIEESEREAAMRDEERSREEEELQRVIEESKRVPQMRKVQVSSEDEEFRKGVELSLSEIYPMKLWSDLGDGGGLSEKIALCDDMNAENGRFENLSGPNIIQVPCLYQAYPGLPANYCGYYAAYFAIRMLDWPDGQINLESINDRGAFNEQLEQWLEYIKEFGQTSLDMIGGDAIKGLIIQALGEERSQNVLVEGVDFFNRSEFNKSDSNVSKMITNFRKDGGTENLCFIFNTSAAGSHWIAILATKNGQRLIIADPLATNRTGFDYITDLYKAVFGK